MESVHIKSSPLAKDFVEITPACRKIREMVVAREYGIPALMAASGATTTLKDGEEILVDGSRGVVVRVGAGGSPHP